MTRDDFTKSLVQASQTLVGATKKYVSNDLPDDFLYLIVPNASYDGNELEDDEEVFPDESLEAGTSLPPKRKEEVIDLLHRNGKIPEWIDMRAESADDKFTYLLLTCCGRYSAIEKHLYHRSAGTPPFSTKIELPAFEFDPDIDGKFALQPKYKYSEQGASHNAGKPAS
ncbi:hypothetical protein [Pelagicoccus sp. SDUM812002]|uniref:hypothetical protein n=1 Tax=Pelagicoccus sp. SDUM812002 TaxID=3041266 RepID=UPI00280F96DB|nr:hypothetical protein [Pelagicoccus sp. SDUM812002]MDQ8188508.1 hypothetical protein [Pelagicoccus sp. SDUM812002]